MPTLLNIFNESKYNDHIITLLTGSDTSKPPSF